MSYLSKLSIIVVVLLSLNLINGLRDTDKIGQRNAEKFSIHNQYDSDSLHRYAEVNIYNTSPTLSDSDADGINDSRELVIGTNPIDSDTDNDGINDSRELVIGTNPVDSDTDDDGLSDRIELKINSNPLNKFSDNDGINDGKEYHKYKTNPTTSDSDNDGLLDGQEVRITNTNPNDVDTDNDTVSDSLEVQLGLNPTKDNRDQCTKANRSNDTDNDGVNNFKECIHGLDKLDKDTDGDGLTDLEELRGETKEGYQIPESNPAKMDLYIAFGVEDGLSVDDEVRMISNIPVENPNGATGITVHHEKKSLSGIDFSGKYSHPILERRYKEMLISGRDHYRAIVIDSNRRKVRFGSEGFADAPGDFAASRDNAYLVVHEILHLVLGKIEDSSCYDKLHVCREDGIMSPEYSSPRITDITISALEEGFKR
jgi:hypothetical protein